MLKDFPPFMFCI